MAFDACMMRAVISEITANFLGAKVEKVLQPQNDEVDLLMRGRCGSRRIVFNVGPNAPRMQVSDVAKENPLKAPMFCMLLRKRLGGAKLLSVSQPDFDRIAVLSFSAYDEMGFSTECRLICEIMGKYANLILTDGENQIISALKLIDFSDSTVRQILPGMAYRLPEGRGKLSPLAIDPPLFMQRLAEYPEERTVEKFITDTYGGIATQIAHELCYRACGQIDVPVRGVGAEQLFSVFSAWQALLLAEEYTPTVLLDVQGKPKDNSYMPITYCSEALTTQIYPDFASMFDFYFAERDRLVKIHQRAHDLTTLLNNAIARTQKKLALQREALLESDKAETYRRAGDLITANIYRLSRGMSAFVATDYSVDPPVEVEVPLDGRLSPAANAQKMYKLYNKAKTAGRVLTACIAEWERELLYLESVKDFLLRAESEEDLLQLRDELYRNGYASKLRGYRPTKVAKLRPLEFTTHSGYRLLVGKNNTQNDYLTFKVASKGDLWFHAKDLPGSHVLLLCDGEEPGERDYTEAAAVAAYHSKATADLVAVDYTRVKNIKKPQGSKPGFVTYKTNYTAFVHPAREPGAVKTGGDDHG